MLFPSTIFMFVFAPITIVGYWLLRNDRIRRLWLTVASYIFYGYWDWRFTSLMFIASVVNYYGSLRISRARTERERKLWLVLALAGSLALLGYFKYFMLLLTTLNVLSRWTVGGELVHVWNIILPIGISFFTFQAMSYTIDVYRKQVDPTSDFIEFACFVALFPQLIAGPIVRYRWISDTLRNLPSRLSIENLNLGLFYFTLGLVKKVLVADRIAYYIDPMFLSYQNLAPVEAWLAIIGFSLQLYFDFAGYSLMAIGLGHLLGIQFPQNFNSPYQAVSISDFWRRWHITLSTWLRDYLYVPLGGRENRAVALAVTMLLGGLWHGAAWTFMIWGAFHAVLLELHHHLKKFRWIPRNVVWARTGTFLIVTIGWVFFRPPDFEASWVMLQAMFDVPGFLERVSIQPGLLVFLAVALAWAMLAPNGVELIRERKIEPGPAWAVALGVLTAVCVLLSGESGPFLYFQF